MKLGKKYLLLLLSLVIVSVGFATKVEASVIDESISGQLAGANTSNLVVVPSPDGSEKKEYASTAVGLKQALFDLYQKNDNGEYAIYFGTTIANLNGAADKAVPASPSETNMTFSALEGRIKTLVLTANAADTITDSTSLPTGTKYITLPASAYMGTNVILRNIDYRGTNLYMNGHDLSLNGGSYGNGLNIYGGSDTSNVIGSPTITVNATGTTAAWSFSGGNNTAGTLTGNTTLIINNVSSTGVITIAGGGKGGNVDGNVTNTINVQNASTGMSLGRYIGGSTTGSVTGTVTNSIRGYGKWSSTSQDFIGGSLSGNIGSNRDSNAIVNNIDTSMFNGGSVYYAGANYNSGTITGNIINIVKAGGVDKGSLNRFDGAVGQDASGSELLTTSADSQTAAERQNQAELRAAFKVYGDITNTILEGCISARGTNNTAFTRGAGYKGYYEGNISTSVGIVDDSLGSDKFGGAGFVYSGNISTANLSQAKGAGISYRAVDASRAANNYYSSYDVFDIVGGGGSNSLRNREIYIKGNTNLQLNNVMARWTYGGGFSGVTEGNSQIEQNGGVVDTLEGAGYQMYRTYGNSTAILNNGQVDDFFCGGTWSDQGIMGSTYSYINGGYINATFGGNFGDNSDCFVAGDANVVIRGGNFSGQPRRGWRKALSPGPSQSGKILGNTEMTIDLRGPEAKTFVLPAKTNISAGKPDSTRASNVTIGTDASNTMTLNIYTDPNDTVDRLNGAIVLGDSAPAANTNSGKVIININAPNSSLGTIYATEYSNISGNKLLRDVNINIQNLGSIAGLSGGGTATTGTGAMSTTQDNFTNTIVRNSTNKSVINIGKVINPLDVSIQAEPIVVGNGSNSIGIINFTDMKLENGIYIQADSGNVKNGNGATRANHHNTYNEFGDIYISDGSGFGVTTSGGLISAGEVTVEKDARIESYQGAGIINLTNVIFEDSDNSVLTWIKNNTAQTTTFNTGTWFGRQPSYQVLTINPDGTKATQLTPFNFKGMEKETGKTFIGDNDVTNSSEGYGLMVPGSTLNYEVKDPIVDGVGYIHHNVKDVSLPGSSPTWKVWGTEKDGVKVQKGQLIVPTSSGIDPTMTFTPETETTGSWLYNATISSSKIGSTPEVIDEQPNSNPADWTSSDGSYSYDIEVRYSNKVELDARSIILTETEAASTSKASIEALTEVNGRPFLTSNIDAVLAEIQTPLGEDEYSRQTAVNYTVGTATLNPTNTETKSVNVIVVKDGSVVSPDRHGAIFAESAILKLADVDALTGNQIEFEKQYTNVRSFKSDGSVTADGTTSSDVTATPSTYFDRLDALTDADVQDDSQVTYNLQYGTEANESVSITVNVTVMPNTTTFVVKFVNELGEDLHLPITSTEMIGSTVDLTARADIKAAIETVKAQRFVLEERPGPDESAILVENGGTTVEYKFKGVLVLSAPDIIDFDKHKVTMNDTRVETPELKKADNSATNLAVFDNRADRKSWSLTAKLTGAMANTEDGSKVLANAIKFNNGATENALTGAETVIKTHQHGDAGDYIVSDDWSSGGSGIKLVVPAGSVTKLGEYRAEITWILGDTPTP